MGFKGVEKKFNECLRRVSKMVHGCCKDFLRLVQGRWIGVPLDLLNGDSRVLQKHPKEVQSVFQGMFKAVSKMF